MKAFKVLVLWPLGVVAIALVTPIAAVVAIVAFIGMIVHFALWRAWHPLRTDETPGLIGTTPQTRAG